MGKQHGFDVVNNRTRKRSNPQSWAQFEAEVAAQSFKKTRRKPNMTASQMDNLVTPGQSQFLKQVTRPCQFVKKNGERCKCWAMRGASRCQSHGGYREVPGHPATVRLYQSGAIQRQTAHKTARAALYQLKTPGREAARSILLEYTGQAGVVNIMHGVACFMADDCGIAWRRWITDINARTRTPLE